MSITKWRYFRSTYSLIGATSWILSSCTVDKFESHENFEYMKKEDAFSGIDTSTATGNFPINTNEGTLIQLILTCIKNNGDENKNEINLVAHSQTKSESNNSNYFHAFIYKIDDKTPQVYQEPNPMDEYIASQPDDAEGKMRKQFAEASAVEFSPPTMLQSLKINMKDILLDFPHQPSKIQFRFILDAPVSAAFGSRDLQFYSQFPSKDISVEVRGKNFGKVLSDCGIGLPA